MTTDKDGLTCTQGTSVPRTPCNDPLCPLHGDDRDTSVDPFRMGDQTQIALAAWEALQPDPELQEETEWWDAWIARNSKTPIPVPPSDKETADEALSAPQQACVFCGKPVADTGIFHKECGDREAAEQAEDDLIAAQILEYLIREGRPAPPMTAEQAERFFDQHGWTT